MRRKKLTSINKSILFNRGSKKFIADVLSTPKFPLTKHDLNNIEKEFDLLDKTFYISKTSKTITKTKPVNYKHNNYRKLNDACPKRKAALKKLNMLLSELPTPSYLYSKSESDFLKNAKAHFGNTHFVLLDIKSFFPNCTFHYVKNFFTRNSGFKMKPDLADRMAKLVTRPKTSNGGQREIPQGFPTSTLVCFFAYKKMFDKINKYAYEHNLVFSTYVDDLTFSSKQIIDSEHLINYVCKVLSKYNHEIKKTKCRIINVTKNQIALVTGILLKKNKISASSKIHSKMIRTYSYLTSTKIMDANSYFKSWKKFLVLNGILQTINYIEPTTITNRKHIIDYVSKNKKNYLLNVSPSDKRFKLESAQIKLYNAFLSGNVELGL